MMVIRILNKQSSSKIEPRSSFLLVCSLRSDFLPFCECTFSPENLSGFSPQLVPVVYIVASSHAYWVVTATIRAFIRAYLTHSRGVDESGRVWRSGRHRRHARIVMTAASSAMTMAPVISMSAMAHHSTLRLSPNIAYCLSRYK